jgi:hypothetical protein
MHCSGTQHALWPIIIPLRPMTLTMSRDNSFVAVGYGPVVHLYRFEENWQVWKAELQVDGFISQEQVKSQIINFSLDGQHIIVATQRYDKMRGWDDDGMHARVWMCEESPKPSILLEYCQLPTVSLLPTQCAQAFEKFLTVAFIVVRTTLA